MFSSLKLRLLLGVYVFLILSIPVGAYLVSQQQTVKSRASEIAPKPTVKPTPKVATSSAKLSLLSIPDEATPEPSSSTIATSFGPTLSLKAALEGRPVDNQATKLFVGIIEGTLSANPKFILSFSINLPISGTYTNLSLAGLISGTKYTALLKGPAQIATPSEFYMAPAVTNLNDGEAVNLITGDLNEDNIINSADYSIIQKAFGSTSKSSNWNGTADFNKDGVINAFDLSIVAKNLGKTGASGLWTSPIPKAATPSGAINPSDNPQGGYWLWIPGIDKL
ncbi:MAG: Uncharacterized protein G01um10147_895 [Microgenomates group bacterium Gr01-1014_7]|nr:MAG: Uncharacterized protein G01um10147_895 [Microgenomates group bacterium Gr01-1014_7]